MIAIHTSVNPAQRDAGIVLVPDADADRELDGRREVLHQPERRERHAHGGGAEQHQRHRGGDPAADQQQDCPAPSEVNVPSPVA